MPFTLLNGDEFVFSTGGPYTYTVGLFSTHYKPSKKRFLPSLCSLESSILEEGGNLSARRQTPWIHKVERRIRIATVKSYFVLNCICVNLL